MTAKTRRKPELSPYLAEVDRALRRAARRAREIARATGTAVVFLKDGKMVKLWPRPRGSKLRRPRRAST